MICDGCNAVVTHYHCHSSTSTIGHHVSSSPPPSSIGFCHRTLSPLMSLAALLATTCNFWCYKIVVHHRRQLTSTPSTTTYRHRCSLFLSIFQPYLFILFFFYFLTLKPLNDLKEFPPSSLFPPLSFSTHAFLCPHIHMNSHTYATQTNIYQHMHQWLIPEYMHTYPSFHINI